jgi:hypothetical protein
VCALANSRPTQMRLNSQVRIHLLSLLPAIAAGMPAGTLFGARGQNGFHRGHMMSSRKCDECEKDEKTGFNYCRKCGHHIRAGIVHTRLAIAKTASDRFCGNCGKPVQACRCGPARR